MKTTLLFTFFISLVSIGNFYSQISEAWVARYNGPGYSEDVAYAITTDGQGYIYIAGTSDSNYATIKYNSEGLTLWTEFFDGYGKLDEATSIAVDGSGNVYVTGSSQGLISGRDYATIKYNQDGVQQWVQIYNGTANNDDIASSIAVDGSGNVYVTGRSIGTTGYDYATIKYNSEGVQQWVKRYNGGVLNDFANAIAIDGLGNVYVTGQSDNSSAIPDYATIKYNSEGVQQWVQRYTGTENGYDGASSISLDAAGNIYVTGGSVGNGTGYDYATIKYNSDGIQQWIQRYNGTGNSLDIAISIVVDGNGNAFVTGRSTSANQTEEITTIKYNSNGVEQWVSRYEGYGQASSIELDNSSNLYIVGAYGNISYLDYITIKYNSDGVQQWVRLYNGSGYGSDWPSSIAVDFSGNAYVTGGSYGDRTGMDYATIKYNSDGVQNWIQTFNGPENAPDYATSIALSNSGNVYATGYNIGSYFKWDYVTLKYNSSGILQWVSRYDFENSHDKAYSIAVDNNEYIYVTGSSNGDYATIKYSSDGFEQWVQRYNGLGNAGDTARAITIDELGNVYVTGTSKGSGSDFDYATIKYNTTGIQQWVARYNGPGNGYDDANSIAVDNFGNVYVTGTSRGSVYSDYATVKYNSAGIEQWVQRYNGTANNDDIASSIACDASGNIFVTGSSKGSGSDYDYATIKYSSEGVEQWVQRYNGQGYSKDNANSMILDNSGNIFVTGSSIVSGPFEDYATIKYTSEGVQQWLSIYNGLGNGSDYATSIAADNFGNVYVTGTSKGNVYSDYATVKYNPEGIEQWVQRYNGTGNYIDNASSIAIDVNNYVYITGSSKGDGTDYDFATIKYSQVSGIKTISNEIPDNYSLYQNYPNPFNPVTKIKFSLPNSEVVKIIVFDLLGKEINYLINEYIQVGTHELEFDADNLPSGVYFYRMISGSYSETRKMLLLR